MANFLLKYRITPQSTTEESPADILLKHTPRTKLTFLKPSAFRYSNTKEAEVGLRGSVSRAVFVEGAKVFFHFRKNGLKQWRKGVVSKQVSPLTYYEG